MHRHAYRYLGAGRGAWGIRDRPTHLRSRSRCRSKGSGNHRTRLDVRSRRGVATRPEHVVQPDASGKNIVLHQLVCAADGNQAKRGAAPQQDRAASYRRFSHDFGQKTPVTHRSAGQPTGGSPRRTPQAAPTDRCCRRSRTRSRRIRPSSTSRPWPLRWARPERCGNGQDPCRQG